MVSALPSTSVVGTDIYFKVAAGTIWHLLYTGEETLPWTKIGGAALLDKTAVEKSTASTSYVTLENSPTITTPAVKIEANVRIGARLIVTGGPSFAYATMFTSGGAEVAATASEWNSGSPHGGTVFEAVALTASMTYTLRYKTSAGTSFWNHRYIEIDPTRVG